ncbi:Testicular acid phosphatase-like protein [Aphelenchoides besseyi]|nr:Testicular acid phosphatase-like protein [Aphelenchoides besseyi]
MYVIHWSLVGVLIVLVTVEAKELKFVQAIFRHGDRAPGELTYPNDKYDESYWPRGWDQLTNIGMAQLVDLGDFFQDRYADDFVSKEFNVHEVYVQSSDSDRALVSAAAFLSGFFPPTKKEKFDSNLKWQPLPIHSTGPGNDPLLRPTSYKCPYYDFLLNRHKQTLIEQLNSKYKDLLSFLPTVTGESATNYSAEQIAGLDGIQREIAHDLKQPEWVERKWPQYDGNTTLELIMESQRVLRNAEFDQFELAFLRGGFLLNDWVKRVESVVNGNQTKPSHMQIYSSHDGTLLPLLHLLDLSDNQLVPYAACILMEIYEDDGQFYVQLLYRHNGETTKLKLKDCDTLCPLAKFLQFAKPRAIDNIYDLQMYCQLSSERSPLNYV